MTARRKKSRKIIEPKESVEEMIGRLKLHEGCWAIEINGQLLVFPQDCTRAHVEGVLKDGYDRATGADLN